jgi:alkanesulfonate monooxygenase SsuD/methylene tetrahydromethanopterin reductase-like flavin-dependent oxidoreductase (luciferase family)
VFAFRREVRNEEVASRLAFAVKEGRVGDIKFGYCVPIFANTGPRLFRTPNYLELDAAKTMQLARLADDLGYDSLWVADHLMLGKDEAIMEGWTTISALAGATTRASLGMIHQGHYFRHPAVTAKMTATLDQISGGRVIHFYDVGTQKREHDRYGLQYPDDPSVRYSSMVEGIQLAVRLWTSTTPIDFEGKFYTLREAAAAPRPVQQPHPPIWFGEANPDVLQATARYAQGWNTTPVSVDEFARRTGLLREACKQVGRNFEELELSVEIQVLLGKDSAAVRETLRGILQRSGVRQEDDPVAWNYASGASDEPPDQLRDTTLIGTSGDVAEQIRAYVKAGAAHFMLWFLDAPDEGGMRQFADEVAPLIRSS